MEMKSLILLFWLQVNEIVEKSHELKTSCPEIKWHFIGRLQSNKVNKVVGKWVSLGLH